MPNLVVIPRLWVGRERLPEIRRVPRDDARGFKAFESSDIPIISSISLPDLLHLNLLVCWTPTPNTRLERNIGVELSMFEKPS